MGFRFEGKKYAHILDKPYRWKVWAAPKGKDGNTEFNTKQQIFLSFVQPASLHSTPAGVPTSPVSARLPPPAIALDPQVRNVTRDRLCGRYSVVWACALAAAYCLS